MYVYFNSVDLIVIPHVEFRELSDYRSNALIVHVKISTTKVPYLRISEFYTLSNSPDPTIAPLPWTTFHSNRNVLTLPIHLPNTLKPVQSIKQIPMSKQPPIIHTQIQIPPLN